MGTPGTIDKGLYPPEKGDEVEIENSYFTTENSVQLS